MAGPETTVKQEREQNLGGWNRPPTPLPATTYTPQDDLHWSFCYDDYCSTHLQAKQNNNYFPTAGSGGSTHQQQNEPYSCRHEHHPELDAVIQAKHLNIGKAYQAWQRGKQVCYDCGFLVNLEGHEARCDASRPTHSSPSDKQKTDASALAGKGSHNTSEQHIPNDLEGPTEQQEEVTVDRHRVPVLVVPAMGGPEGVAVSFSLYQQVTEESTA
jgi:hypothetical protein